MEQRIKGDRIREISMYKKVKSILIDFLRGYPAHKYYGIIESEFDPDVATEIRNQLKEDGIIKFWKIKIGEKEVLGYSLTGKGAQLASSLSTRKRVDIFKWVAVVIGGMSIVVSLAQLFLSYFQNPVF